MGLIVVFRRVEHPRWLTEPLHGQTVYQDYKIIRSLCCLLPLQKYHYYCSLALYLIFKQ